MEMDPEVMVTSVPTIPVPKRNSSSSSHKKIRTYSTTALVYRVRSACITKQNNSATPQNSKGEVGISDNYSLTMSSRTQRSFLNSEHSGAYVLKLRIKGPDGKCEESRAT